MLNVTALCVDNERIHARGKIDAIVPGKNYLIDMDSVAMDIDGDAYGDTRDENGNYIGRLHLEHFDIGILKGRKSFMNVVCRDTHRICQDCLVTKVIPDNTYLIDRNSIFVKNGKACGDVYTESGEFITVSFLKNFRTV